MNTRRIAFATLAALMSMVTWAADPPSGYKDVTTYKQTSIFSTRFNPLVPNDQSKAADNSTNLGKMIAQGVVLYFPPGTYWINKTVEINKASVTFWGEEGSIICRTGVPNTCADGFPLGSSFNATANFMITANNFKMHGLTIKYDVPTSFTGEITAKSGKTATVRLTDGQSSLFSTNVCISRVNYFDSNLRPSGSETFFSSGSKLGISNLTTGSDGVKTFKCSLDGSAVGQKVAMACGSNYAQNIIIYGSSGSGVSGTVFEDVTVANSFGMVMLVNSATNVTIDRLRVDDGNPDTIYTTSVDGIHVNGLAGKLTMRDCVFNGLADDMLNVHCKGAKVGSVSGTTVTLEESVGSVYFQKNHTVRFYSAKFVDLGTATISSVTTSSGNVSAFKVGTLPSDVAAGCYIANESWLPEVEITGTTVGVTRARGFLLQTDKPVTIADCTFENTRLAGILCAPGGSWGEMGPVNGVKVTNCTFRACGVGVASGSNNANAAITVRCDHDKDTAGAKTANRNVWVGDCFFEDCTAAAVGAVSVTGLVVTNNVFLRCGGRVPEQDSCMVRLKTCDDAKVVFNTAYGGGFTNDVMKSSATNVEAHDNGFRDESEWGAPPVLPVLPVLGTPVVSRGGDGTFSISVSVSSNAPASVVCVDRGSNYPMTTADTSLPATYSAVLSGLAAGTHLPSVQAVASNGTPVSATCPHAFHVGPLAVAAVSNADTGALAPGVFRVSRADADPTGLPALSFDVAFSGAGLAAVVPPGVSSATIPAGASSVDISVTPVSAEGQHEALDLVMAVSGAYVGQASSATMQVLHTDSDATVRYVAQDGDDANDGVSPALPKRTIANAVESLAALARTRTCTVRVAPGTYTLAKETDDPITVTNAIRIVGTGATPEDVVVQRIDRASANHSDYRNYQDLSLFHLNHPDALVANLVLHYGSAHQPTSDTTAGSAWIGANGGTISNCVVRGGRASHPYAITAGILMLGPGLVTHCVITNNSGTSVMESSWAKVWIANAVVMKGTGGRLENCLIRDNRSETEGGTGSDKTSTVYATGTATLANCTIVENRARNCAGVFADGTGVTVRNCVVAGNVDVGAAADNPNWMGTGTFAACATDDAEPVNGTCFSGALAAFFPRLAENVPVALKFRPAAGGPLCDRGVDYEPMAGVDLSGVQPRKIGAHVDIGCCEAESGQQSGYAAWIAANGISGAPEATSNGIANGIRYAFDIAPSVSEIGAPIIDIGSDAGGGLSIKLRSLAENRGDVTYGVLATEALGDWSNAQFVPFSEFTEGCLRPSAVWDPAPAKMFFKYKIDVR